MFYKAYGKRFFDIFVGFIAITVLFPVFLVVGLLVSWKVGRPVLFKQHRPGLSGVVFTIYKFRSMTNEVDDDGDLLSDAMRLGRFGAILRSSSLDEIPALINVLKGDMSLVGPRPLLVEYLSLYSEVQSRRHEVRPGITGWAQVNGRNTISWEDKFRYDVWYVDNMTFLLDLKILYLTIKKVFLRDGINADGEATMSKFTGIQGE